MRRLMVCISALSALALLAGCASAPERDTTGPASSRAGEVAASAPTSAVAVPSELPPGAKPPASRPDEAPAVAAAGKKLQSVEVAPPQTYAMFELPDPFSGAEFDLEVRPYGWAETAKNASVKRLVVKVEAATPVSGQTEAFPNLQGRNALVWIDRGAQGADTVREGGVYRIRVAVQPSGGTGALRAVSVERTK